MLELNRESVSRRTMLMFSPTKEQRNENQTVGAAYHAVRKRNENKLHRRCDAPYHTTLQFGDRKCIFSSVPRVQNWRSNV